RHVLELLALAAGRGAHHLEGVAVRRLGHLGRVFLAQPAEAERLVAERIADRGAQDVDALGIRQRREFLPALAVEQLDLLGRLAPFARRPQDIGAQADRLAALDAADDFERQIVPAGLRQRARFEQQALL